MEIIPNSNTVKKETGLAELSIRKMALKVQIEEQKMQISASSKRFLAPISFTTILFQTFGKGISVVDSVLIGYKIVRSIKKFFDKQK